jgi:hypothetical protein
MNNGYQDICDRIAEEPLWWDERAVPRYVEFSPEETANIYCEEALLLEIACQECGRRFQVCMSADRMDSYRWALNGEVGKAMEEDRPINKDAIMDVMPDATLAESVRSDAIHYGDPPNVGCCAAGATMNSVPIRVLEFWSQEKPEGSKFREWTRHPELEVEIHADWAVDWDRTPR